ncbi:MAG: hypothetical protein EZS26_004081, partial [Candidatus Ordinivivax streblomastigis]
MSSMEFMLNNWWCFRKYAFCLYISIIDIKERQSKSFQVIEQLFRKTAGFSKS